MPRASTDSWLTCVADLRRRAAQRAPTAPSSLACHGALDARGSGLSRAQGQALLLLLGTRLGVNQLDSLSIADAKRPPARFRWCTCRSSRTTTCGGTRRRRPTASACKTSPRLPRSLWSCVCFAQMCACVAENGPWMMAVRACVSLREERGGDERVDQASRDCGE